VNKLFAVLKREYLQSVRRKMFIIMTVLLPFLMAAAFIVPGVVMVKGVGTKRIVVVDGTSRLRQSFDPQKEPAARPDLATSATRGERDMPMSLDIQYVTAPDPDQAAKQYIEQLRSEKERVDGVFVVPSDVFEKNDASLKYYSRSSADIITQERLGEMTNRGIRRQRLEARGMSGEEVDQLVRNAPVDAVQVSKTGQEKRGGSASLLIGLLFGFLLTMPSFIYGVETMRGIIQEKNDRVVEVLVSSMTPKQLLTGKIMGIAAVGLTQIAVWMIMLALIGLFGASVVSQLGIDVTQYVHLSTFVYFMIFFLLAYLTNVCVYAIAGAVSNSDREAQQMIGPVVIFMMMPMFLLGPLITNPDSKLFVALSMAPAFGPMIMFVRTLITDPPITQVLVSMLVSVLTVSAALWATAKIFRIGILSYGKRPTIPELWRWAKES
jgi:ABC-2 type transport system permease protein